MDMAYFLDKKKVMKISVDLDCTNVNIAKGILGKINFKVINPLKKIKRDWKNTLLQWFMEEL